MHPLERILYLFLFLDPDRRLHRVAGGAQAALLGEVFRPVEVEGLHQEFLWHDVEEEIIGQRAQADQPQQPPFVVDHTSHVDLWPLLNGDRHLVQRAGLQHPHRLQIQQGHGGVYGRVALDEPARPHSRRRHGGQRHGGRRHFAQPAHLADRQHDQHSGVGLLKTTHDPLGLADCPIQQLVILDNGEHGLSPHLVGVEETAQRGQADPS